MSELTQTTEQATIQDDSQVTFQSENSWMVQCLSLAALGLVTYIHVAPMVYAG